MADTNWTRLGIKFVGGFWFYHLRIMVARSFLGAVLNSLTFLLNIESEIPCLLKNKDRLTWSCPCCLRFWYLGSAWATSSWRDSCWAKSRSASAKELFQLVHCFITFATCLFHPLFTPKMIKSLLWGWTFWVKSDGVKIGWEWNRI